VRVVEHGLIQTAPSSLTLTLRQKELSLFGRDGREAPVRAAEQGRSIQTAQSNLTLTLRQKELSPFGRDGREASVRAVSKRVDSDCAVEPHPSLLLREKELSFSWERRTRTAK
jgi:hypothetical protein